MPATRRERMTSDDPFSGPHAFTDGLIGRADELSRLRDLLVEQRERIVTLTGPGGVGKTRLAWEIGRAAAPDFSDGAAFVPLAAIDRADRVLPAIARSLAIVDDEERLAERLVEELRDRETLLVLDNLEHLPDAARDLAALADACPDLTLLITSRRPLHMNGESVFEAPPLATTVEPGAMHENAAVQLFLLRAQQANRMRPIGEGELSAVAEICARLDGLPLAIELAANWMRATTPSDLLPRLVQRLPRLKGGAPDRDPRHQTMRAAIAWSYELLTPDEQALFRRLAIFSGGFTLKMAEKLVAGRVAGAGYPNADGYDVPYPFTGQLGFDPTDAEHDRQDPGFALALPPLDLDALDGVTTLFDHSLLRRVDGGDGQARYDLLETIREFGLEQLDETGETSAVRHAHAAVMLAFSEATAEGLWHAGFRRWDRARVDLELPNIRAALTWLLTQGDPAAEVAQRLAGSLWIFWQTRGLIAEGRDWMERTLSLHTERAWTRASQLPALGFFYWIQGDDERAAAMLDEAVRVTHDAGLFNSEGAAHFFRALVAWRSGPEAVFTMLDHLERAHELFQEWGDDNGLGVCNLAFGVVARLSGNPGDALELFDQACDLFIKSGYDWGLASAHYYAGEALRDLAVDDPARFPDALARLHDGLRRYWAQGDHWGVGGVVSALASAAAGRGEDERAARFFGGADALLAKIGAFLPPTDLDLYRATAASVRERMGPALYDRAYADGQAAASDEIVVEALSGAPRSQTPEPAARSLTNRQLAIVRDLILGLDVQAIAIKQQRSQSAVYEILHRICERLGLINWEEIAPFAIAAGLTAGSPPKTRNLKRAF